MEFEYIAGGSLDRYTNLSTLESTHILCQLSSALDYLHNQTPSIAHRDIKPENILVVERGTDGIYVKFADFGLSKAADTLKTFCGTLLWAAPEIYLKAADPIGAAKDTYSVAIDIWSLGVVVASLECGGLPVYEEESKTDAEAWTRAVKNHVIDKYNKQGCGLLLLLLDNMLIEDPDERSSADFVHDEALKFLQTMANSGSDDDDESSATPKPSILSAQSVAASENAAEATKFRLDIQSAPDGSQAPIRETVEHGIEGLNEISKISSLTDPEKREWLGALDPEIQPSQFPEIIDALPQGSIVDGLL